VTGCLLVAFASIRLFCHLHIAIYPHQHKSPTHNSTNQSINPRPQQPLKTTLKMSGLASTSTHLSLPPNPIQTIHSHSHPAPKVLTSNPSAQPTPPPKSTTSPPQTNPPATRARPKSSPAACAKKRKPPATSACSSPRPKTRRLRARIWLPSIGAV
jgi:hypothetical protein